MRRLGRRAAQIQDKRANSRILRAETGKEYDDGSLSLYGSAANNDAVGEGLIWVRVNGQKNAPLAVWNMTNAHEVNVPVRVVKNEDGEYETRGIRPRLAVERFGAGAAALNIPPINAANLKGVIWAAQSLGMGRIRLKTAGTLLVCVDDFTYVDTEGKLQRWTADSGSLDLTASVPASGLHNLILVSLNPDATTPALVASSLTARAITYPFTTPDLASFVPIPGYYPLATVRLVNGDTTFTADRVDYAVRTFLSAYRPPNVQRITNTAMDYTILLSDETICVTDTTIARTMTLPAASACFANGFGQRFVIVDKSGGAGTNNISAATVGGDTLLGTGVISANYGHITVQAVSSTEFAIL